MGLTKPFAFIGSEQEMYLLDTYGYGEIAGFSFRKIKEDFTGDVIQIQRASDSAITGIQFVDDYIDTGSIETFCSGTYCTLDIWYDQRTGSKGTSFWKDGGNYTSAPIIYESGSIVTGSNGKVAVTYRDGRHLDGYSFGGIYVNNVSFDPPPFDAYVALTTPTVTGSIAGHSIFKYPSRPGNPAGQEITFDLMLTFSGSYTETNATIGNPYTFDGNYFGMYLENPAQEKLMVTSSMVYQTGSNYVVGWRARKSDSLENFTGSIYVNNSLVASNTNVPSGSYGQFATGDMGIDQYSGSAGRFNDGLIQELIYQKGGSSTGYRSAITDNINNYYNYY